MTSIIVLNYKRPELTIQCLESIVLSTRVPYRVILVDNGSPQEQFEMVLNSEVFMNPKLEIHTIRNQDNKGFPKANNQGIKLGQKLGSDYFMLLNNDTLVTDRWLKKMIEIYEAYDKIGMVGPKTNPPGWASNPKVRAQLSKYREKFYEAFRHSLEMYANEFDQRKGFNFTDFLAFYCVLISDEIIEEIGLLNEVFGLGTWEDDDYCERVKNAGYRLAVARNVYIHHIRNQTLSLKEINPHILHKRNRAIFDELHPDADYQDEGPDCKKNCTWWELLFWRLRAKLSLALWRVKGEDIYEG